MEDRRDSRFIDELLDAALAQYRGVAPRPGLENRILAQLRAESKAPPYWTWPWRIGAGLVTVGVVLALVSITYRQRPHAPVSVAQSPKPAATAGFGVPDSGFGKGHKPRTAKSESHISPSPVHASTPHATQGAGRRRDVLSRIPNPGPRAPSVGPRRDVFPSPAPLSEEEKLLVSYVREWPDAALAAFPEDSQPLASLKVPDLKIPPLEMKELPGTTGDPTTR